MTMPMFVVRPQIASFTTWDSSKKSANITLSGGNLTATNSDAINYNSVGSIASFTTGAKRYWEITIGGAFTSGANGFGFGNASFTWTPASGTIYLGHSNSAGFWNDGVYIGTSLVLSWSSGFTSSSVIGIAVDFNNTRAWWRVGAGNWNNSGTANPATNTGGVDISSVTGALFAGWTSYGVSDVVTANFGGSAFANAAPSGFTGIS